MKNGKKPTLQQKRMMKAHGLKPEEWLVIKNTQECMEVVNRMSLKKIAGKPKIRKLLKTGEEKLVERSIRHEQKERNKKAQETD